MKVWFENKRLGLDCDDVLFDFVSGLAEFHNKHYGTKLKRKDFYTYHFREILGCEAEEADERVDRFLDSPDFDRLLPLPGAVDGVNRLLEAGNGLCLVSSMYKRLYWRTAIQLNRHFLSYAFEGGIHLSRSSYTARGNDGLSKADICVKEKLDAIFEDSPEYALECAEQFSRCESMADAKVVLIDSPWNKDFKTPRNLAGRIVRTTWDEIQRKTA